MDRIADIVMGVTTLAMVAVIVGSPNTRRVISAVGGAYADAINAATRPAR